MRTRGLGSFGASASLALALLAVAGGATAAVPESEESVLSIETASPADEPDTPAVFTVKLSAPAKANTSVRISTGAAEGADAATAGADYEPLNAVKVEIPKGERSAQFDVDVIDDALDETREKFVATLSSASAPAGITIDPENNTATGWIDDNDAPPAAKIDDAADVPEGNSSGAKAQFTINLSKKSGRDVRVEYATRNGSAKAGEDYAAKEGVLRIPEGELSGTVTIDVTGDKAAEGNETFVLALSPHDATATIGEPGVGTVKIVDDDAKPEEPLNGLLSVADASAAEPVTGSATMTFTVTLAPALKRVVTLEWATGDGTAKAGSDYTAASGTLSFAPGETTKKVSVTLLQDDGPEDNETFFVNLSGTAGAGLADAQGMGTIVDRNAPPSLSISDTLCQEGDGATFAVELTGTAAVPVTVTFSTSDGTAREGLDYLGRRATLTFQPGETRKTISVTVVDDAQAEGAETFSVTLGNPVNGVITKSRGVATIEASDRAQSGAGASTGALTPLPVPVTSPPTKSGKAKPGKATKTTKTLLPRMVLGPRAVTVDERGVARMIVACKQVSPVTCSGRIALETAAKPKVELGAKSFAVKKGKRASVPIKLRKQALELVEERGTVRVRVIVFVRIGKVMRRFLPGVITVQSRGGVAQTASSASQP